MSGSVLKPWLMALPYKRQSAYLSALRGPDHAHCHNVKMVTKLLRAAGQHNADGSSAYMHLEPIDLAKLERELEFCSLHFVAHLVDGLSTVAVHCPVAAFKGEAQLLCDWFEEAFHLRWVGASALESARFGA